MIKLKRMKYLMAMYMIFCCMIMHLCAIEEANAQNSECYLSINKGQMVTRGVFRLSGGSSARPSEQPLYLFTPPDHIAFFVDDKHRFFVVSQLVGELGGEHAADFLHNSLNKNSLMAGFQVWNPITTLSSQPDYQTDDKVMPVAIIHDLPAQFPGIDGSEGFEHNDRLVTDTAFSPSEEGDNHRLYFMARKSGSSDHTLFMNNKIYDPAENNPVRGNLAATDSNWIGVAKRDSSTDHVYALGTTVVNDWHEAITGKRLPGMNITAVSVTDTATKSGGTIFAYDDSDKTILRFVRNESMAKPLLPGEFKAYSLLQLLSTYGLPENSQIDDLEADNSGNIYIAVHHFEDCSDRFATISEFSLNDAFHIYIPDFNVDHKFIETYLLFRKTNAKRVFKLNTRDETIVETGSKTLAQKYFNLRLDLPRECILELTAVGPMPHKKTESIIASWTTGAAGDELSFKNLVDRGSFGLFYEYDYGDPGKSRLAVISN